MIKIGGGGYISYGGGSSGVGGGPSGEVDIDALKDIAREELRKEAPPQRRRIFISFRHTDKALVDFLRGQSKNKNNDLDFIDMSVQVPFNSENAEYIKRGIRARIKQSSVNAVLVTDNTHESEWVDWEVNESKRLGKGVVVIDKRSNSSVRMPSAVNEHRDSVKIVPWKHDEIVNAINDAAENR